MSAPSANSRILKVGTTLTQEVRWTIHPRVWEVQVGLSFWTKLARELTVHAIGGTGLAMTPMGWRRACLGRVTLDL